MAHTDEKLEFYIDTIPSRDRIDVFYLSTRREAIKTPNDVMLAMETIIGLLAHMDSGAIRPFDPYRLAMDARRAGVPLGLSSFAQMDERMRTLRVVENGQIDRDLVPIIERYIAGFKALEQAEGLDAPFRAIGTGPEVPDGDTDHELVQAALDGDAESQYRLAGLYLDPQNKKESIVSYDKTEGIYWLQRAAAAGYGPAMEKIETIPLKFWK